ncbi:pseudouridine synthase [Rhodopseudomonas palustris]|uniref:pseudouridine synthase n=1 Tax=Rhodopseudomonas palustris TaxID=1076 RepID=UPI0021F37C55|nr:pseudouridine synthase [Rhodopseudomonas palustris]UYO54992.1 pseudouridine synthase [Rhodopseudomonas palustris]
MPRDTRKDNDSARGRRDRQGSKGGFGGKAGTGGKGAFGGKGRSGAARGPEKKFAKRAAEGAGEARGEKSYAKKSFSGDAKRSSFGGEGKRPYAKRDGAAPRRDFSDRPRRDDGDAPRPRFGRDDRPARSSGDRAERGPRKEFGDRPKRDFGDRPKRDFSDRPKRDFGDRPKRDFSDRPKRDFADRPKRPFQRDGEAGRDRGDEKPWRAREDRPARAGGDRDRKFDKGGFDKPRFSKSRDDKPRFDRDREDKPRFDKARGDKPRFDRGERSDRPERGGDRPKFSRPRDGERGEQRPFRERSFDRPREDRPRSDRPRSDRPREDRPQRDRAARHGDWHEHPRSEGRGFDRPRKGRDEERGFDRPRRDNEDDSRVFAKRPAFGGRGAFRKQDPAAAKRKPAAPAKSDKAGERIAKVVARAGLCSRRDAETWITEGRVTVNGKVIDSPALDVKASDVITIDGKPLPERERTRLFLYHKPRGLMTTHSDPEGRPTVFDNLPEGLPRLISIGRLDFNTEGLLLLTNDGGLARALELPETGWLRRYRVRAHGEITQAQLDELQNGIEVDGVQYGPIEAKLDRDQGANVWLVFAIREGKNREVRNVLAHLGLEVNRLIRVSYGPFQLLELGEGEVDEVKTRVLRDQLGEKVIALAGCDFAGPSPSETKPKPRAGKVVSAEEWAVAEAAPAPKKTITKRGAVEDRKGRKVKVERTASEGGDRPLSRGPARRYHGKRDAAPRDE